LKELSDPQHIDFIQWLKKTWNVEFDSIKDDVDIQGSPERTSERIVFKDTADKEFLLEKFPVTRHGKRNQVAKALDYLAGNGLKAGHPYYKSTVGEFLPFYGKNCFALSDFITGTPLKRPEYLSLPRMGESMADFIIDLSMASANIHTHLYFPPFSLGEYIYSLFSSMRRHNPSGHKRFLPYLEFLQNEGFMEDHEHLRLVFCHGDLHPLNVIWNRARVKAVIDWEFAGFKPDIYDAANLVGCAGIENPEGLGMPMVLSFIKRLLKTDIISPRGWELFPEYILALRFAWLSEWLRKQDEEMIEMEACYMDILMKNHLELKLLWNI